MRVASETAKNGLPKSCRPHKLCGLFSPAHRRFLPLAAWLLALACLLVAPLRAGAVLTPPQKTASGVFEPTPWGRPAVQPTGNQDCIMVAGVFKGVSLRGQELIIDMIS